jgi:hypothetical protein
MSEDKGSIMVRSKMKKDNEINACNALIKVLERVAGVKYECESFPDEISSSEPEIDFILRSASIGMERMAVEHTVIELFTNQNGYLRSSFDRAEEINRLCQGKIPPDRFYYLTAPHSLINSLTDKKSQTTFDECLAFWTVQTAQKLQIDDSEQYLYQGYKITLTCGGAHPQWNGKVGRIQEYPANVATLQKESFDKAIKHGLNKFSKYKHNRSESFKTVLLLEDVAGLQHERIMEGLIPSEKAQIDESIDYIVVLHSLHNRMIVGYVWKENETWHRFIPADRRFDFLSEH